MITVFYRPKFIKHYQKLPHDLQKEVLEKIVLFRRDPTHSFLKTHKLKGQLKDCFSFSVNYRYRVLFYYIAKNTVALLAVGDHDVYR